MGGGPSDTPSFRGDFAEDLGVTVAGGKGLNDSLRCVLDVMDFQVWKKLALNGSKRGRWVYNRLGQEPKWKSWFTIYGAGDPMKNNLALQLAFAAVVAGSAATASPITWTIDATLDDGATVTGSFVYDPDLASPETLTTFNIAISAPTISTLLEPDDGGLPTSIFPAFDFTPSNSTAAGPFTAGNFSFQSGALTYGSEALVLQFVPLSPLTDLSSTTITNSDIAVNNGHSAECFDSTHSSASQAPAVAYAPRALLPVFRNRASFHSWQLCSARYSSLGDRWPGVNGPVAPRAMPETVPHLFLSRIGHGAFHKGKFC
jgi:hypothetical protein